jgi:3-mercaptopropionate dioxygenase
MSTSTQTALDGLVRGVRAAMSRHADWHETARIVAYELDRRLPSPDVLTVEQRVGDPDDYRSHLLHTEPDGSFSIVALAWRPGQMTPIHDHVTWCVFGVIQGTEYEELFTLDEERECLVEVGSSANRTGDVSVRAAGRHPPRPQQARPGGRSSAGRSCRSGRRRSQRRGSR